MDMDTEREDETHDQQMEIDQQLDGFYQHNSQVARGNDYEEYPQF